MARTERERRRGEMARLVGAAKTSAELAEWRRLQWKNPNILSLPKRKRWSQCHEVSSWQGRQSRLAKRKRTKPTVQIIRSRDERELR